ncbi:hypothetical protein ACFQVC_16385 [Streptomyces monticola]|uniref:Uncharacterized protein n=1 Tax=Streptomyces monticola TaxID=2666263 RepID=A0ABW2JJA3_9ACTN
MRATRRTIRTAAIATGAVAAFALPAGAAFADASAAPSATPSTAPSDAPATGAPTQPAKPTPPAQSAKPKPTPPAESSNPARPAKPGTVREFIGTTRLEDGSVAKVYKVSADRVEAEIWADGSKLDTLVSEGGKPAHGENNGLHITVSPDATVKSWTDGGKGTGKGKDKKRSAASAVKVTMPDGRIARLMDGPRIEISMPNGNVLGTLDRTKMTTVNDGWTYKIDRSGHLHKFVVVDGRSGCTWVYDFGGKLIEKYSVKGGKRVSTASDKKIAAPQGGVKAGAEGAEATAERTTGSAPMVAAGGGMAALGAAGLGFAILRRGTNG